MNLLHSVLSTWAKVYLSYDQGEFCASQCVKTMSERTACGREAAVA